MDIKYKGFKFAEKKTGALIAETDKPFEWFPEAKKLFQNMNISRLEFTVHASSGKFVFVIINDLTIIECSCEDQPCGCKPTDPIDWNDELESIS